MVLVSFGLVLLATILLVVGLLTDDGLNLVYLSIACSVTAAVVLYLAFRRARPAPGAASSAPAPLLADEPAAAEDAAAVDAAAPSPVPPPADVTAVQPAVVTEVQPTPEPEPEPEPVAVAEAELEPEPTPEAEPEPAPEPEPVPAAAPATAPAAGRVDDWVDDDDWADVGGFDVEFPIADYDELTVDEIMPLLPQLYSDELDVVAERERATKGRAPILARLAELATTGTDADAEELAADADQAPPAPAAAPAPTTPAPTTMLSTDDAGDDHLPFPIADYDRLSADQILPLLTQLEDDELEDVRAHEAAGPARPAVVAEIDRQLARPAVDDEAWRPERTDAGTSAPAAPAAPAPTPAAAPTLPIDGYEQLTVAQIRPQLARLGSDDLQAVLRHEVERGNRRSIVSDIERRLARTTSASPAPVPAEASAAKKAAKRAPRKAATRATPPVAANDRFPIEGYDTLTVAQIRPQLATLDTAQLRQVRERELAGAGRKSVIADIDRRLR